jgi:beta-glucanase (GH16 family)
MRNRPALGVSFFAAFVINASAQLATAQLLFREDFNGSSLNRNTWMVGTWNMGRAQFGHVPRVANGVASLRLDTYNPSQPGRTFKGTEILSKQTFSRGPAGLEIEARMRMKWMPNGLISAFYTYAKNSNGTSDELDFEFLSNWTNKPPSSASEKFQVTSWNDWNRYSSRYYDGVHHTDAKPVVSGLDLMGFNTFKVKWFYDRTEWYVNGRQLWVSRKALPTASMPVKFNFWAPASNWAAAYSSSLMPTSNKWANRTYEFDVDYVLVRRISPPSWSPTRVTAMPEPGVGGLLLASAAALLQRRGRAALRIADSMRQFRP